MTIEFLNAVDGFIIDAPTKSVNLSRILRGISRVMATSNVGELAYVDRLNDGVVVSVKMQMQPGLYIIGNYIGRVFISQVTTSDGKSSGLYHHFLKAHSKTVQVPGDLYRLIGIEKREVLGCFHRN